MNYHDIRTDDMLNGEGLRVVLFVSGCVHGCKGCQNPQTWDTNSGKPFTIEDEELIMKELSNDYISGLTLSGGDPMHPFNRESVLRLCKNVKNKYPHKTIWLYTGYKYEQIKGEELIHYIDVVVDGKFEIEKMDANYEWCGSTNQNVIKL